MKSYLLRSVYIFPSITHTYNQIKPFRQEKKVCNARYFCLPLSHCLDLDCEWQTWIAIASRTGVLKFNIWQATRCLEAFTHIPYNYISFHSFLEMEEKFSSPFLTPWCNVYTSKPLKCQASKWLKPGQYVHGKLVNSAFFCPSSSRWESL